ncbi:NADP-dependent oxidoreductase [Mycobacterium intracellulare]|uniref:NADP-dependent oxidoreductase n=1 Tax=Mycobacterium intracellulare TaxID=1767 RepID=UPI00080BC30B|nr:zinc-binding dehydrogenase [Mycobacterium intracellulare]OCB22447.1 NADP-dependent oxidoreductase [Mycobacterium intracellulare subsp. yongonense]
MPATNTRVVLQTRPTGIPSPNDFRIERAPMPEPADGEVLLRNVYLSLDPYIRGRIGDGLLGRSRAKVPLGGVVEGGTVGEVVESRHPDFRTGEMVLSAIGWQKFGVQGGGALRRLDPDVAPLSTYLGVLGMPGFTAYVGLNVIARPRAGETVVVAAATGPVGSMVGQLAGLAGARAVGVAGGSAKTTWLTEAGFDAAVDHRRRDFAAELARAAPDGIDVYFENVGGRVFDGVLPLLNSHARVPVCGLAAHYNGVSAETGPAPSPDVMAAALSKFLLIQGFAYLDYVDSHEKEFHRLTSDWFGTGRLRYLEDVEVGLENAPQAFIRLVTGRNFGKSLVLVSPDPTRS